MQFVLLQEPEWCRGVRWGFKASLFDVRDSHNAQCVAGAQSSLCAEPGILGYLLACVFALEHYAFESLSGLQPCCCGPFSLSQLLQLLAVPGSG